MSSTGAVVVAVLAVALVGRVSSQTQPAAGAPATDLYHVNFSKAVPGEAVALGEALALPDKTAPMPDHFVVLRHQEGDDWDYMVIQHLGQKAARGSASVGTHACQAKCLRPPDEAELLVGEGHHPDPVRREFAVASSSPGIRPAVGSSRSDSRRTIGSRPW